ncbi:cold shock domain-containing protein [Streptomyces sp. NPDC060010]|uniref:cold shock domain-containing protein n=1 Tax=Streptomyces sp. NPDC060010 TaxID=3347036 RepID=UPI0036CF0D32
MAGVAEGRDRDPVLAAAMAALSATRTAESRSPPGAGWLPACLPCTVGPRPPRSRRAGASFPAGARRLRSRRAPLFHAPAQALPTGGDRADSVEFRIRCERRAGNVSPCGVVKWFDPDRGTGLISQQGAGPDVFVEASAIHGKDRHLHQGEEVFFNITLDSGGLRADDIHRTDRGKTQPSKPSHTVPAQQRLSSPANRVVPAVASPAPTRLNRLPGAGQ